MKAQKSPAQIAYDVAINKAWQAYMTAIKRPCHDFAESVKKARRELEASK